MPIDIDRGVTIRQIVAFNDPSNPRKYEPDINYGGMAVYMYKDEPGVYYNAHGQVVPEPIAERAGFPTAKLAKAKRRRDAVAALEAQFRAELDADEQEAEIVLAEGAGYKVVQLPMGRAKVVDADTGLAVTPVPMPVEAAKVLFGELTKTPGEAKLDEPSPTKGAK